MIGKHLYKKTPHIYPLIGLLMVFFYSAHAFSTETSRHRLLVEFLHTTGKDTQWHSVERLAALEKGLLELHDDGLDPSQYQLSRIQRLLEIAEDTHAQSIDISAAEDAAISGAYLEAIADLMLGRTRDHAVDTFLDYRTQKIDQIKNIIQTSIEYLDTPALGLSKARPQVEEYQHLRTAHQRVRHQAEEYLPLPPITPDRPSLRPGMTDPRIALLRQHLDVPSLEGNPHFYDQTLASIVSDFQRQQGLQADGIAGPATLARLNRTPDQELNSILINLERWRRVNLALTESRVITNIAGATLRYYHENQLVLDTRTQVGRRDRPTPLMMSEISHFTLNPTWTIPPTIYRNDKLPAIQNDTSYLTSNRLTVLDTQGNRLDPESVDWNNPGSILLRQSAGPHNALGQVVIRFPNQQSIFLHDTPSQRLFQRDQRYFSSGCVRVEDAHILVSRLLESTQSASAPQYESLLRSGVTQNVSIRTPITIVLGYWTAEADSEGVLQVHTDIYDLDEALLNTLKSL